MLGGRFGPWGAVVESPAENAGAGPNPRTPPSFVVPAPGTWRREPREKGGRGEPDLWAGRPSIRFEAPFLARFSLCLGAMRGCCRRPPSPHDCCRRRPFRMYYCMYDTGWSRPLTN